ncbi:hypothetical protein PA7559_21470 [Pseudoalteromonas distincta]
MKIKVKNKFIIIFFMFGLGMFVILQAMINGETFNLNQKLHKGTVSLHKIVTTFTVRKTP